MKLGKAVEFWFEFGSTYSYPVAMKIEKAAAQKGVPLTWRAFLLGPIFQKQGWNDSPFNIYPEKGRYMWRDLERVCEVEKLGYRRPSVFPRNGLRAARIACINSGKSWIPQFVRSIYAANFELDLDISEKEVVRSCLPFSEQESHNIVEQSDLPEAKELLRQNTDMAAQKGIFGAPTFIVGEEVFWGGDRLEAAIRWARK